MQAMLFMLVSEGGVRDGESFWGRVLREAQDQIPD